MVVCKGSPEDFCNLAHPFKTRVARSGHYENRFGQVGHLMRYVTETNRFSGVLSISYQRTYIIGRN